MDPSFSSLIIAADQGDGGAAENLFNQLYSELHWLARRELVWQGAPMSLGASSLLHEAYVSVAASEGPSFPGRAPPSRSSFVSRTRQSPMRWRR